LQQIYEDQIFNVVDGKKVVKGEWWYLLHNEATCSAEHGATCDKKCVQDYPVAEFGLLITNMRNNIEVATLNQLSADGMISGLSSATLNSTVKTNICGIDVDIQGLDVSEGTKLGDLTVVEMLQYGRAIFEAINKAEEKLENIPSIPDVPLP
jgi:hypothetical protein